ncbi:MAG: dephospho-CoA kinase [Bacteroidales bacterium]|nr:dephospho-CoA kinase [Candidatus Sodaliphilus aphodohippi]
MSLIAITGGIGAGKSVVSHILSVLGYPVYDCDSEAKRLMVCDSRLVQQITELFGHDAYCSDGSINREYLSRQIFNAKSKLALMNSLVHPVVLNNIVQWSKSEAGDMHFVETALFAESGMNKIISTVWNVTAPVDVRIRRVARRSNLTDEQVLARINSQSEIPEGINICNICNDDMTAVLPQVLKLLYK